MVKWIDAPAMLKEDRRCEDKAEGSSMRMGELVGGAWQSATPPAPLDISSSSAAACRLPRGRPHPLSKPSGLPEILHDDRVRHCCNAVAPESSVGTLAHLVGVAVALKEAGHEV